MGKSFHPVVGFDYAGKSSFTTNVLYFKQQFGEDKTPDEIAKEKGFVRGAKKAEQTTESSEQSNETPAETNDAQLEETEEAPAVDEVSSEETSTEDSFNEE